MEDEIIDAVLEHCRVIGVKDYSGNADVEVFDAEKLKGKLRKLLNAENREMVNYMYLEGKIKELQNIIRELVTSIECKAWTPELTKWLEGGTNE